MAEHKMEYLLRPRSVVIVGASQKKGSIGHNTVRNFIDLGFQGNVYCVNPRYEELEGFPCFPTVADVPGEVDVAIIAVPLAFVENAIKECAEKKVSYAVIFSAGFAEMGEEGKQKQEEIKKICEENNIRVIGPNTMGITNVAEKINLSFSKVDSLKWIQGNVGLVSQSGATGHTILTKGEDEKLGFAYMITTGNQLNTTTLDVMEFLLEDEKTEVIASYMEAVPNGEQLKEIGARALQQHKPIIVYKSGRSEAGKKAALSHTASLTGSSKSFQLVAEKYGLVSVDTVEEIIDALKAFNGKKFPKGNRVATVVISGATGIMIADNLTEYNQELVPLTDQTKNRLREVVADYLPVDNPVDIASTLVMNPAIYKHCLQTLAEAEEVDSIIAHLPLGKSNGGLHFAKDVIDVSKTTGKPIFVLTTGSEEEVSPVRHFLNGNNVPAYSNVISAIKGLDYLVNYQKIYAERNRINTASNSDHQTKFNLLQATTVTEPKVKSLLRDSNIPVPNGAVAKNEEELVEKAAALQFPLVAKVVSPEITHKSDVGGVVLPIKNEEELIRAYHTITENVKNHAPNARMEGILIEELVEGPFLETIVGVNRDPVFGPIIMCGLGGVYVEVLKDVSQRLLPITEKDALEMVKELKSYPLFNGFRNGVNYDVTALACVLADISHLALSLGDGWSEIEINPLIVRELGKGVMALDGLITVTEAAKEAVKH
ncbi:acetate--CoA ligase family protein [Bacillus sp. ISL-18]|uniref:acetate--CoA ligase family protein n=1 Tax=Bacillus sp. ISL-18 TaxID=2819118 RepID=UPI001BE6D542|nr:acetate--CoA ligase family protein [Bacillus sp. ISL-18]MBT2655947.1 acetate--CoA ligase family protein [Bacillus sp. ISL-18]